MMCADPPTPPYTHFVTSLLSELHGVAAGLIQVLVVLTVPTIALFGFLLGELSGLITHLVAEAYLRITLGTRHDPEVQVRRWTNMLRQLDIQWRRVADAHRD